MFDLLCASEPGLAYLSLTLMSPSAMGGAGLFGRSGGRTLKYREMNSSVLDRQTCARGRRSVPLPFPAVIQSGNGFYSLVMSEAIEMVQELDSKLGDIVWMLWRVECECVGPAAGLADELGGRPLALARGRARVSFHRMRTVFGEVDVVL